MVHETPFFAVEEERQREARAHTQYCFFFFFFIQTNSMLRFFCCGKCFAHREGIERKTLCLLKGRCDDELVYKLEQYQICQR